MYSLRRGRISDSLEKGVREAISRKSTMAKKESVWIPNLGAKGWGITIVCLFYFFFYTYWNGITNTLLGILTGMYGWSQNSMSFIITIGGWISLIAIIFFGIMGKKSGAKKTAVVGLIGTAISFAILAVMQSFVMFAIGVILFYITMVAYGVIGTGLLGSNWFPRKKGIFMGFATCGMTLASASLNPILLGFVGSPAGLPGFFWFCAAICVVLAIVTGAFVKNNPEEAGAYPDNDRTVTREELNAEFAKAEEYKKNSPWTLGKVMRTPQTWLIGIGWGLTMMVGGGIIALLVPAYMAMGHSQMFGVGLLSGLWWAGLLGNYLIGIIDLKFGTKFATFVIVIIEILSCLGAFFAGTDPAVAGVCAGCFMFALSGNSNVCMSMTTTVFGRQDFDNAWTPIQVMYNIFNFAGVSVMSVIGTSFGMPTIFLGGAIITAIAIIPIALTSSKQIASHVDEKAPAAQA